MDQTSSTLQSSSENMQEKEPQSAGTRRSSRASSPDFPLQPSPDMPAWMTKCVKIMTGPPEDVKTELLKLLDECSQRREQRDRPEALVPSSNLVAPKKEAKIQPVKPATSLPIPPAKANTKKRPASPKNSEVKQSSLLVPPVVTLQSPGSPEFAPPPSMTLSAGTSEGMDIVVSSGSGSSGIPMDVDEVIDLAMLLEDPCFVCGQGREEPGNRLLDCESCRKKYHQQCHVPKVTDIDPADTRLIWYCAQCSAERARRAANNPLADPPVTSAAVTPNPVTPSPKPQRPMATKTVHNKEVPSSSAGATSVEPFKRDTAKATTSGSQGRGLGGYASSIKKDTKTNPGSKR